MPSYNVKELKLAIKKEDSFSDTHVENIFSHITLNEDEVRDVRSLMRTHRPGLYEKVKDKFSKLKRKKK